MAMNGTVTILSNAGGGRAKEVKIVKNMTLAEIFHAELGISDPDEYSIFLNCKTVSNPKTTVPKNGDTVVITPKQMKGN